VSRNSHFFLHDGHCSGGVSASNEYPQLLHFQLGMAITSSVNFFVISGGTLIKQLWSFSKRQDSKFYLHIYCFSLNIFSKNIQMQMVLKYKFRKILIDGIDIIINIKNKAFFETISNSNYSLLFTTKHTKNAK